MANVIDEQASRINRVIMMILKKMMVMTAALAFDNLVFTMLAVPTTGIAILTLHALRYTMHASWTENTTPCSLSPKS